MPIGFLDPFVPCRENDRGQRFSLHAVASVCYEGMEVVFEVGIVIDDCNMNGPPIGVMIGYWALTIFVTWVRPRQCSASV